MKTLTLSSVFVCLLFAATGNAPAQNGCTNCPGAGSLSAPQFRHQPVFPFYDPSRQAIHWATAEQIRAMACLQRAIAEQEWVKADRSRRQFNLEKRNQSIRQPYLDGKALAEAKTELRRAVVEHRRDLLEKTKEVRDMVKQEQEFHAEKRRTDTAYVLDIQNGGIRWTGVLADNRRFVAMRQTIDGLVRGKSGYMAEFTPQERREIFAAVKALDLTLKQMVADVSPQSYCEAKKFLADLTDQVRFSIRDASAQMATSNASITNSLGSRLPVGEIRN